MNLNHIQKDLSWVESVAYDFIKNSKQNTLQNRTDEKAFENILLGCSRGDDPLFVAYKDHVGPFHWTPLEIFRLAFPDLSASAEELTVISWVLPQTAATKSDNRQEARYPSERWVRARTFGEMVNVKLREHMTASLSRAGFEAVAPMLYPLWARKTSEKYGFASTWSERHAAYASGLGTFGLSDGLITPRGKAMRVGSLVARIQIPPSPRHYSDHHAYCLFFTHGICGKCIRRCPAGAITKDGHDKIACKNYIRGPVMGYIKSQYGFDGQGCGLCQTGIPCESKIPVPQDVETPDADLSV